MANSCNDIPIGKYPLLQQISEKLIQQLGNGYKVLRVDKRVTLGMLQDLDKGNVNSANYRLLHKAIKLLDIDETYLYNNAWGDGYPPSHKPTFLHKYHISLMFQGVFNKYFIDKYKAEHLDLMFMDAMKFKNYRTLKYLLSDYLDRYDNNIIKQTNEQIKCGNIDVVLFLLDEIEDYNYMIDESSMEMASVYGRLKCIVMFHKYGVPYGKAFQIVAHYGHLECLQYLRSEREWDEGALSHAAHYGHFECMKYLYKEGCALTSDVGRCAIRNGNLKVIKWCYDNKCHLPINSISLCAKFGHVDCLEFFHKLGYEWGYECPIFAAYNGNLECLKYLSTYQCPWDERTIAAAAKTGHFDCMRHAFHNNCPINNMHKYLKSEQIHPICREYVHKFIMTENGQKIDLY